MIGNIVVTGDSRGLGKEITQVLLENGNSVIGISRTETESTEEFQSKYNNSYYHIEFDLTNIDTIDDLYFDEIKPHGPIHGLVNNAAVAYDDLLTNADPHSLEVMFKVNTLAPILLSKYIIRDMILHRTKGSIVHISSVSTTTGYTGLSMYAATKGALESFSRGVSREWGERKIRSNCIAPGFMDTDMTEGLDDGQKSRIFARTGLGEPTSPKSVAETVRYLLSEDAASLTGETVRVDSGTL
jgi:3-oxoacyl-[acyl-carrier protein] reductase